MTFTGRGWNETDVGFGKKRGVELNGCGCAGKVGKEWCDVDGRFV